MNTDRLIRDRMKDLGLKYEREFTVNNNTYLITLENRLLKEEQLMSGGYVWISKGYVRKWLWSDEWKVLEDGSI